MPGKQKKKIGDVDIRQSVFKLAAYGSPIAIHEPDVPYGLMLPQIHKQGSNAHIAFQLCRRLSNGDYEQEPSGVPTMLDAAKVPGFTDALDGCISEYRTKAGIATDALIVRIGIRTFLRNQQPTLNVFLQLQDAPPVTSIGGVDSELYGIFEPIFAVIGTATQTSENKQAIVDRFESMSRMADTAAERTHQQEQMIHRA